MRLSIPMSRCASGRKRCSRRRWRRDEVVRRGRCTAASQGDVLEEEKVMKRNYGIGLIVFAVFAIPVGFTEAQTTANGPYYATPSWDQTLPSSTRFIVLANMNSDAVLDRETGLVWEKAPSGAARTWHDARSFCANKSTGGRKGWRLPSLPEMTSLLDPTTSNPALPAGHPFVVPT